MISQTDDREKDSTHMRPTYEEIKKRVAELEREAADCKSAQASLRRSNDVVNSAVAAARNRCLRFTKASFPGRV